MKSNLTLAQQIGIKWLTSIDSNAALYLLLKPLPVALRMSFYVVLIAGIFLILKLILSFIEFTSELGSFIALVPTLFASCIIFYELLYVLNIEEILKEKREKKQFIKAHKLQKWRLRNMSFWVRLLLYLVLYIASQQFIQITSTVAFFTSTQAPTQAQIMQFIREFQIFIKWFTVSYVAILGILEYFIAKRKAKQ